MRAAELMCGHHPHPTVADFALPQVLALTYTANDMDSFARDTTYMLDTFPIVREQDIKTFGSYRTQHGILQLLALL